MINPKLTLGTLALLATVCQPIAAANAATYNWSFSDGTNSGMGTLTTGAAASGVLFSGGFIVTDINGSFDSATNNITGLDASFDLGDNVFYPSGCTAEPTICPGGGFLVDNLGLSFDTTTAKVNIFDFFPQGGYADAIDTFTNNSGPGASFTATLVPSTVPLPAALPLFATGLGALGLLGWRRKRKAQAVA